MKRKTKIIVFTMVCVLIFAFSSQGLLAEVGNSGGFGGGGGSSSGGSSGGFSSGGGGYSGGSGGGTFFIGGFGGELGILIFILAIAIRVYSAYKKSDTGAGRRGDGRGNENSRFNTVDFTYKERIAVESITEHDPDFSASKFKAFVGEVYIIVQEAWEAKDWKGVRPVESNELFNQHNRQLQEYIDSNKTNHLDMQDVRMIDIASYEVDGDREILVVRLNAVLLDFTTDDNTGKVIDGSKTAFQERSYRLEFVRTLGVKTNVEKGLSTTNCPNCGAPTSVTSSGECEYCHSVITNGKYGWVLNKYGAWR